MKIDNEKVKTLKKTWEETVKPYIWEDKRSSEYKLAKKKELALENEFRTIATIEVYSKFSKKMQEDFGFKATPFADVAFTDENGCYIYLGTTCHFEHDEFHAYLSDQHGQYANNHRIMYDEEVDWDKVKQHKEGHIKMLKERQINKENSIWVFEQLKNKVTDSSYCEDKVWHGDFLRFEYDMDKHLLSDCRQRMEIKFYSGKIDLNMDINQTISTKEEAVRIVKALIKAMEETRQ